MARRSWIVFCEDGLKQDGEWGGKYNNENKHLCVFFRERDAIEYAKHISAKCSGSDVYIYEQKFGYYVNPNPPIQKVWTVEGQYIPV